MSTESESVLLRIVGLYIGAIAGCDEWVSNAVSRVSYKCQRMNKNLVYSSFGNLPASRPLAPADVSADSCAAAVAALSNAEIESDRSSDFSVRGKTSEGGLEKGDGLGISDNGELIAERVCVEEKLLEKYERSPGR